MIRCEDNSLYTGITTDLKRRLREHKNKDSKCAKYTFVHHAVDIQCAWVTDNKSLATKLEFHLKKLTKKAKEDIIKNNNLQEYLSEKIDLKKYKRIESEQYEKYNI